MKSRGFDAGLKGAGPRRKGLDHEFGNGRAKGLADGVVECVVEAKVELKIHGAAVGVRRQRFHCPLGVKRLEHLVVECFGLAELGLARRA